MLKYSRSLNLIFFALSDPSRRAIVEQLSKQGATVSELAKPLNMSMAGVVQHVQVLQKSGLIKTRKVGRVRSCSVEPASLEIVQSWLDGRRKFWERNLDQLGEFLEKGSRKER